MDMLDPHMLKKPWLLSVLSKHFSYSLDRRVRFLTIFCRLRGLVFHLSNCSLHNIGVAFLFLAVVALLEQIQCSWFFIFVFVSQIITVHRIAARASSLVKLNLSWIISVNFTYPHLFGILPAFHLLIPLLISHRGDRRSSRHQMEWVRVKKLFLEPVSLLASRTFQHFSTSLPNWHSINVHLKLVTNFSYKVPEDPISDMSIWVLVILPVLKHRHMVSDCDVAFSCKLCSKKRCLRP